MSLSKDKFSIITSLDREAKVNIKLGFMEAYIDYEHRYELDGYYPLGVIKTYSLIKDFNLDPEFIPGARVDIFRPSYDNFGWKLYESKGVNVFGEFDFEFREYGSYKFILINSKGTPVESVFISYFSNEYKITSNETREMKFADTE